MESNGGTLQGWQNKSNRRVQFFAGQIADLILSHNIVPMVNQIETHPFCQEKELRQVMAKYGIQPMAWAPFAEGEKDIFKNALLSEIGNQYGKSCAQVILRWFYQNNIVAIPKSVHSERIKENFNVGDFILSPKDMKKIETMDMGKNLILDIQSLNEVKRLHNIRFEQ